MKLAITWGFIGLTFFALGFALMRKAFLIADEPSPPLPTRFLSWFVGGLAVWCLAVSVWFAVHGLIPSLRINKLVLRCANCVPPCLEALGVNVRIFGKKNEMKEVETAAVVHALSRGRWVFVLCIALLSLVLSCTGLYRSIWAKPQANYITQWGAVGDGLGMIIDTTELIGDRPKELMIIAVPRTADVEPKTDTRTLRSVLFEIQPSPMTIAVAMTPEFKQEVIASKANTIIEYLLEVPKDFPVESVHSVADAQKRGAKILGARGMGTFTRF